jgi:uncharacterized protein YecT (DUF1311 family)
MRLAGLLLAACAGAVQAGALQDCTRAAADGEGVVPCLRDAREAATDEMLERFLDVEQSLVALGDETVERGRSLLKASQRAFERYVLEHCHAAQSLLSAGSEAAILACETDLLRQRAQSLQALEIAAGGGR